MPQGRQHRPHSSNQPIAVKTHALLADPGLSCALDELNDSFKPRLTLLPKLGHMGRIIHFEITSEAVETATQFYADAFGWSSEASPFLPGYHLEKTGDGEGIDGAVMSREYQRQPVILWLQVEDIHSSIRAVQTAGGQHSGEVREIPTQGFVTYVTDPDGTLIGLRQPLR